MKYHKRVSRTTSYVLPSLGYHYRYNKVSKIISAWVLARYMQVVVTIACTYDASLAYTYDTTKCLLCLEIGAGCDQHLWLGTYMYTSGMVGMVGTYIIFGWCDCVKSHILVCNNIFKHWLIVYSMLLPLQAAQCTIQTIISSKYAQTECLSKGFLSTPFMPHFSFTKCINTNHTREHKHLQMTVILFSFILKCTLQ